MENLNASFLNGRGVRLHLKNKRILLGYLPVNGNNTEFEENLIAFLPWEKKSNLNAYIKDKKEVKIEELNSFIEIIKCNEIESYEIVDNTIASIGIGKGKPIPNWLGLELTATHKPGHVNVKYKIPDKEQWFELGDLPIVNMRVALPLNLVFLSYAKEDKEQVLQVMDKLHDNGVLTWFDEKDLLPGDDWEAKIENAIEKADYVVVFFSSNTMEKTGYKNKEVRYALEQYLLRPSHKRYIIPVLLDDCTPPREFKKIQWLKAWDDNWLKKLLMSVCNSGYMINNQDKFQ